MKCTNCGHELEPGSGFCENCGTIMSLDDYNPFESNNEESIYINENPGTARELEADDTEQIVLSEEVPDEEAISGESYADFESEAENGESQTNEEVEAAFSEENEADAEAEVEAQAEAETTDESEENDTSESEAESESDLEQETEAEAEVDNPFDAAEEDYKEPSEEEEDGDDDADMYVTAKKTKKGKLAIAALVVVLVAVVAGGANVIKNNFSTQPTNNVNAGTSLTSGEETEKNTNKQVDATTQPTEESTDEETTEKESEDQTTEKEEETASETTAKSETETSKQTEKATTNASKVLSSSKPVTTTKATTTTKRPTTTKAPVTTKKPTTTKAPSTTKKPSTTKATATTKLPQGTKKPTTTNAPVTSKDPYGFNFATVQKPNKYFSSPSKVYVNTNALALRSKPTTKSENIVYLPLGTSCTAYASQDGFLYVRSDRYGVYGWVSKTYTSNSRPVSQSSIIVPNLVEPDKEFETKTTKYVIPADGLRLRKGPGEDYGIILRLDKGFPVKVIGYSTSDSNWYYVKDTTHGIYGWVSRWYIK